jgi:hypothetical protein
MKKNQIIIGTIFTIFILICTPVLATILQKENRISNNITRNEINVDQKELLFQTIVDIANNKEIQKIIYHVKIPDEVFIPNIGLSIFTSRVLTKNDLKHAYNIGSLLLKILGKTQVHSLLKRYLINHRTLTEIIAVIEKNDFLKKEVDQLSDLHCDCDNDLGSNPWNFVILCSIFGAFVLFGMLLILTINLGRIIYAIGTILSEIFNCPGFP